jgi:hypothetical protein
MDQTECLNFHHQAEQPGIAAIDYGSHDAPPIRVNTIKHDRKHGDDSKAW